MGSYVRCAPPAHLAGLVNCFWRTDRSGGLYRVVPDGCADFVYTRTESKSSLLFVGPMTSFRDFDRTAASISTGVRFRTGMSSGVIQLPGEEIKDLIAPLEDIWGARACQLQRRLDDASTSGSWTACFAESLPPDLPKSRLAQTLLQIERKPEQASLDSIAFDAGLSPRQFRRRCLQETGLSPKMLARIFRFQRAVELVTTRIKLADVAFACGYADQSHMNREYKALAGRLPRSKNQ